MNGQRTNFRMEDEFITLPQGDTLSFGFEVFDKNDEPISLDEAEFSIKDKVAEGNLILRKTLGNGITEVDIGQYVVRVAPEETEDIFLGEYYYDLRVLKDSDKATLLRGVLHIVWSTEN